MSGRCPCAKGGDPVRKMADPGAGIFRFGQVRPGLIQLHEGPRPRGKSWCSGGQDSEVRSSDWNG